MENGHGLDEQQRLVPPEGVADRCAQSGRWQPQESSEPQSSCASDLAQDKNQGSIIVDASEKDHPEENGIVSVVFPTCEEKGNNFRRENVEDPAARSKAAKAGNGVVVHGTRTAYEYHRCRCELCRAKHGARMKEYRAHRLANPSTHSAGTTVTLTCAGCGIEFERRKGNRPAVKGLRNAYHSRSCFRANAVTRRTAVVVYGTSNGCDEEPGRRVDHQEQVRIPAI